MLKLVHSSQKKVSEEILKKAVKFQVDPMEVLLKDREPNPSYEEQNEPENIEKSGLDEKIINEGNNKKK